MCNLFSVKEDLRRAYRHLDEAREEQNQAKEEKAMKEIDDIYKEVGRAILEDLNEDESTRINNILDEADSRIETLELFNELRFINTY